MFKTKLSFVCPCCLSAFQKDQAPYRCVAVPQVCAQEVDAVYSSFFPEKDSVKKGRLIDPPPLRSKKFLTREEETAVRCDLCVTKTQERVCPHCHATLPATFFSSKHIPFVCYAADTGIIPAFVHSLTRKMQQITGHDIQATVQTYPDLVGFDFNFASDDLTFQGVLVSFHDAATLTAVDNLKWAQAGLVFEHIGALFKEKERKIAFDLLRSLRSRLSETACMGLNFYGLESYHGYFPQASVVLDVPTFQDGYDKTNGEWVSQELLPHVGAAYGVNFLRQIRENLKPWRFGVCSFIENQPVPLSSFHRVEDVFLWQLFTHLQ